MIVRYFHLFLLIVTTFVIRLLGAARVERLPGHRRGAGDIAGQNGSSLERLLSHRFSPVIDADSKIPIYSNRKVRTSIRHFSGHRDLYQNFVIVEP